MTAFIRFFDRDGQRQLEIISVLPINYGTTIVTFTDKIRSRMSAPPPRLRAFHFVACQADHPYTESGINIRNTTTKNTKNDMDPASRQHLTLNITSSHVLTYASTNPPCNQISEDIAPADGATNKQTIPRHQSSPLRAEVSAAKPP